MALAPGAIEVLKKLGRAEDKTVPGARVLTPRQQMLDASAVAERHPDKRLRWVNLRNPEKVRARLLEGYEKLPENEGGRSLGDECALFALSREVYEDKVASIDAENARRLSLHRDEMQAAVAAVAKELRDKHGIRVDEKRLFVDE